MAKPIKETPVLKGRDARQFIYAMEVNSKKKVSSEEKIKIQANFDMLKSIAKF